MSASPHQYLPTFYNGPTNLRSASLHRTTIRKSSTYGFVMGRKLKASTVDESQGRDFDIGVLDLTVYERLVFMEGPFGLFVALSRFKHGLVVLGSKHQITHAKGRDQYVSVFLSQSPKTVTYHFDVPTDASLLSDLDWFARSQAQLFVTRNSVTLILQPPALSGLPLLLQPLTGTAPTAAANDTWDEFSAPVPAETENLTDDEDPPSDQEINVPTADTAANTIKQLHKKRDDRKAARAARLEEQSERTEGFQQDEIQSAEEYVQEETNLGEGLRQEDADFEQ
ncbi:hypothetical protein OHC33_007450 [Knufia fluminis]|uniref:Uncharacterized protein n=1 Tax=Knufia fluminis TaxID=191047 RepID=A0AAN8I4A2_9EURO|nr:hypothetical protein OHC33_007450 [Knufia fluminis]